MNKQSILKRIEEGTIETNFADFPERIGDFVREDVMVGDDVSKCKINTAHYLRGNDMGLVTAEDLAAGKLQVRKIDQVKPEVGGRKVIVPSERFY